MATTTSSCSSYSTLGMGPSQGRHSNVARSACSPRPRAGDRGGRHDHGAAAGVAEKFAHLAGRGFDPVRHTPMHHRHLSLGARMMVAGVWLRPAYYGAKKDPTR